MLTYSSCATCSQLLERPEGSEDYHAACPYPTDLPHVLRRNFLDAVMNGRDADADLFQAQLDCIDDAPPRYLDAALSYAEWGWPVFPCREGHKLPAIPKTEGGRGFKDATVDPERIKDWWWRWPRANIGIATGIAFDVIDVDPDGAAWWEDLRIEYPGQDGPLPAIHGIASTPRTNARHIYIEPQGGGNLAGFAPGVDYRGRGGYVLAPPSTLHPDAYDPPLMDAGRLRYTCRSTRRR